MKKSVPKIAFFGGQPLGVPILKKLLEADIIPALVVCNPDRPAGRGQKITTPPLKDFAQLHSLPVFQPDSYSEPTTVTTLTKQDWDLFIVVAYNFMLPTWLLELSTHGVINVHPSLLPKLRGASPIRTAIKDDLREAVGVSIMLMDEKMDHGPILAQQALEILDTDWPMLGPHLDTTLSELGGDLLVKSIPAWLNGDITPRPQDHSHATYCTRLTRSDAELALDPKNLPSGIEARAALHHIYAFAGIGDSYFTYQNKRIKIKQATLTNDGSLALLRVTPAGKSEMEFEQFLQIID
jgi:methionyl-tRNA formyltransferase